MIGITNAGGGGNILRYDVVGQMAEPAKKEGRIWIQTNIPINRFEFADYWSEAPVGWVFVSGGLGGANPTKNNSTIFVINKDINNTRQVIKIRLAKCFQTQGSVGNGVQLNAYVCIENEWVKFSSAWDGNLYYNGNQYTEKTGGWVSTGARQNGWSFLDSRAPELNIGTHMVVRQTVNPTMGTVFTNSAIDVTSYKRLYVNLQYNIPGNGLNNGCGIVVTTSKADMYNAVASYFVDTAGGPKSYDGTISIDLSSVTGNVFIGIDSHLHGGPEQYDNTVTIRRIWIM